MTPFEKLTWEARTDEVAVRESVLGKRISFYRIRGEIGSGNFSQVKLGVHLLTREKVAIKLLDKSRMDERTLCLLSCEILAMELLRHPNVVRLYEVVDTPSRLHLVMEYAPGGELFTRVSTVGALPHDEAKLVFAQITAAVKHMHECGVVHRDLKAENVFYAGNCWVKVGDFGFSTTVTPNERLSTFCGSPPYAAPELFRDQSYLGPQVDVWALGVLLFFIASGTLPFRADTVGKLKLSILDGCFSVPLRVPASCCNLITTILRPLPDERPTAAQILRSEWLRGVHAPEPYPPYPLGPRYLLQEDPECIRGAAAMATEEVAPVDAERVAEDNQAVEVMADDSRVAATMVDNARGAAVMTGERAAKTEVRRTLVMPGDTRQRGVMAAEGPATIDTVRAAVIATDTRGAAQMTTKEAAVTDSGVAAPTPITDDTVATETRLGVTAGSAKTVPSPSSSSLRPSCSLLAEELLEVRELLEELGITSDVVRNNGDDGDARSCVTGTYRIVLHRVQRRRRPEGPVFPVLAEESRRTLPNGIGVDGAASSGVAGGVAMAAGIALAAARAGGRRLYRDTRDRVAVAQRSKLCAIL
ncbi:serine/threonine-protein kinase NIM1 [Petromyzon marinus]|uniref:serine/threonine-protein kinase NIM1 n=1 Tax=Petromyzon marinus TaxID=7757 RepID=UPI003F72EEFB